MDLSKLPKLSQTPPPPDPAKEESVADPAPRPAGRGVFCQSCGSAVPAGQRFCGSCGADTHARPAAASSPDAGGLRYGMAEIWFFGVLAILLLVWGAPFAKTEWALLRGKPLPTGFVWPADDDKGHHENDPVAYRDLDPQALATFNQANWSNGSIFVVGIALAVQAIARAFALARSSKIRGAAMIVALLVTMAATVYNIIICARFFSAGVTPMISMLFVAIGGFLVFDQLALLQMSRGRAAE